MPPEQRQMMQAMMAKQGVGIAGNTMTGRVCMTKEMATSGGVPQSDAHCQNKEVSRTANSIKYSYTCTGKDAGKDAFDGLKRFFSEEEVAYLTLAAAMINTWNRIAISSRAQYDRAMFHHAPEQRVAEPA